MSFSLVFCSNAKVYLNNRILDATVADKYPGASWVRKLADLAGKEDVDFLTSDLAIIKVNNGSLSPSDILIIQEENCISGSYLLNIGARPFLLICAESPLYARCFYRDLNQLASIFENRILFKGCFPKNVSSGSNHVMYFPSYSTESNYLNTKWSERRFMVMVAANKYWKPERNLFRFFLSFIRDFLSGRYVSITNEMREAQLHDKRLELIEFFGKSESLDLFGMNWDNLNNLPREWQLRLEGIIHHLNPAPCENKQQLISNYKFALCLENMIYPGYVTEKIIDCFKAGVIPIYMGAPDIFDFVPEAAVIDMRNYNSLEELKSFLETISDDIANNMITAAQSFLDSDLGKKYSYEGFAKNVMNMLIQYAK